MGSVFEMPMIDGSDCQSISDLELHNYGSGIVLFKNAIDVDQKSVLPYLDERVTFADCGIKVIEENGDRWAEDFLGNVVEGGLEMLSEQALRLGSDADNMPVQDDTPEPVADFFQSCEEVIYKSLIRYIDMHPMILNTLWWKNRGHILKYSSNGILGEHNDNDTNFRVVDGQRYLTPRPQAIYQVLACIIYLNDEYEGGEMYFPYADVEYKPVTGDLLFFPQNYVGTHGVRRITSGERYVYLSNFGQGGDEVVQIFEANEAAPWVSPVYLPWIFQDYETYYNSGYSVSAHTQGLLNPIQQKRPLEGHPEGPLLPHPAGALT